MGAAFTPSRHRWQFGCREFWRFVKFAMLPRIGPKSPAQEDTTMTDREDAIMRKVAWHLVPFVSFAYLIIPRSRENPKICWIYDPEVVGDFVAVDMPVPRHPLAQKTQYCTTEILEPSVAFVVGAVSVHQPPQSFDRVEMRAV